MDGAALAEAGYDHRVVVTDSGHDPTRAGALLPEAIRWALAGDLSAQGSSRPGCAPTALSRGGGPGRSDRPR